MSAKAFRCKSQEVIIMKKAILATKVGMTQIFNEEDGVLIPVTVLQAGPCVVTQVKTKQAYPERDM